MKRYAELIGNYKKYRTKSRYDNKLVCDSDYRGEYIVAIHNDTEEDKMINVGDRIAQLIVMPYYCFEFEETEELSDTARGEGGFGSTGSK